MERKGDNSRGEDSNATSSESSRIWVVEWVDGVVGVDDYPEEENGVGEQEEGRHDQLKLPRRFSPTTTPVGCR